MSRFKPPDKQESDIAKITCPFCHAPWSAENIRCHDLDAGDHCASGRFYAECCTIEITCHACHRLMYRKEGFELR